MSIKEVRLMKAEENTTTLIPVGNIIRAAQKLKKVAIHTPLMHNLNLSEACHANIYLKREDLQVVRSYKIRGAYHKIRSADKKALENGVVCASAGNHAQGVAYACQQLGIQATIFMPNPTPKQKIKQVKMFGKEYVHIEIKGDTFDDAYQEALAFCNQNQSLFIHPFDDEKVIEGQGTVAHEIFHDLDRPIDYIFVPVGGGGLASGLGSYFRQISPQTKIIGV